jgi:hypothetical protein
VAEQAVAAASVEGQVGMWGVVGIVAAVGGIIYAVVLWRRRDAVMVGYV